MTYVFESVLKNQNMRYPSLSEHRRAKTTVTRVAFILLDSFSMMSFTGAMDPLVTANLMNESPVFEITTVGIDQRSAISDLGFAIPTDLSLCELQTHYDILIVAGGLRVDLQLNQTLRRKLRSGAESGVMLGGLWNGAYFLAQADALNDYQCTLHPEGRATMVETFPKTMVTGHSYVIDRDRFTCSGAISSLGMMLDLIRSLKGDAMTQGVEEILRCDDSNQPMGVSSVLVDSNPTLPQSLKITLELMHKNVEEPLSIDDLATYARISRRQLERRFCRFVGASPTRYYLELRLTRARQLVLQTNRPITEIALATGFVSLPHFQKRFRDFFGAAPGSYRVSYERRRRQP